MLTISNHFEPDSDPDNVNEQEDCAERISITDFASMDYGNYIKPIIGTVNGKHNYK